MELICPIEYCVDMGKCSQYIAKGKKFILSKMAAEATCKPLYYEISRNSE